MRRSKTWRGWRQLAFVISGCIVVVGCGSPHPATTAAAPTSQQSLPSNATPRTIPQQGSATSIAQPSPTASSGSPVPATTLAPSTATATSPEGCQGGTVYYTMQMTGELASDTRLCLPVNTTLIVTMPRYPGGWSSPTLQPASAASITSVTRRPDESMVITLHVLSADGFMLDVHTLDNLAAPYDWTLHVSTQ